MTGVEMKANKILGAAWKLQVEVRPIDETISQ